MFRPHLKFGCSNQNFPVQRYIDKHLRHFGNEFRLVRLLKFHQKTQEAAEKLRAGGWPREGWGKSPADACAADLSE